MTPDATYQLQEFSKIKITGSGDPARPLLFMRDLMSQNRTEIYAIESALQDKKISLTLTPEFASQPFLEVEFSDFCSSGGDKDAVVTINSAVGVFPSEGNRNDNWVARKIAAFLPGFRH